MPTKFKMSLFAVFFVVIIGFQYAYQTFQGSHTEAGDSLSMNYGMPVFYSKIITCTYYEGFCTGTNESYNLNVVNLILNIVIWYLVSCLVLIKDSLSKKKK